MRIIKSETSRTKFWLGILVIVRLNLDGSDLFNYRARLKDENHVVDTALNCFFQNQCYSQLTRTWQ